MRQHESKYWLRTKRNSKPTQFYTRNLNYATVFYQGISESRFFYTQNPTRTLFNRHTGTYWDYCDCAPSSELRSSSHALTCARSSAVASVVIKRLVVDFATRYCLFSLCFASHSSAARRCAALVFGFTINHRLIFSRATRQASVTIIAIEVATLL